MNILGFNPSHHGSVCLLQDGKIKHFIQEERVGNRQKYIDSPFTSFIDILLEYKIDIIAWGAPSIKYNLSNRSTMPYWHILASSYSPKVSSYDFSNEHHLTHVSHAFYNSGFKKSIGVIIDGLGSEANEDPLRETETIFYCSQPGGFKVIYKNIINTFKQINLSRAYETITMHLGWGNNEAGKTMGLAPYGKPNPILSNFFIDGIGNPDIFVYDEINSNQWADWSATSKKLFIDEEKNPQLKLQRDPKEWHHDESKITQIEKDLAWQIQNDTQQVVGDYIEKAIKETGLKQVCCAGGYFLNCVANYYLIKRFPNIEFYFEPIANDAGTAIGAAKLVWYQSTQDTTIHPFKSLYLGKQYSKDELLEGIKKYI
mgnify:FL=1